MSNNLIPFEITAYLDSEEAIAEYLSQVQADGDPDELLRAISHVAKAKGIAETLCAPPSDITRPTE